MPLVHFKNLCKKFHWLRDRGYSEKDNTKMEQLSLCMMQYRYYQAKKDNFSELDCHWLTWKQSESVIRSVIKSIGLRLTYNRKYSKELKIICGIGKNSHDGKSVLGRELDRFLNAAHITYTTPDHKGARIIDIKNNELTLVNTSF